MKIQTLVDETRLFRHNLMHNPLWFFIRNHSHSFWWGVIFLILTNIFDGLGPYLLKEAIDLVLAGKNASNATALFVVTMIILTFFRYWWRVTFGKYHTEAGEFLRTKVFQHLLNLSPGFYKKNTVGELMSVLSNDVNTFRQSIGPGLLIFLDAIFMSLVNLPLMAYMNLEWTLKTMVIIPVVPILIYFLHHYLHLFYKQQQDSFALLSSFSQELVAGIRPIKGFAQETLRLEKYNIHSKDYEKKSNQVAIVDGLFVPVMDLGTAMGSVILLYLAADDIASGALTIGTFIAFQRYIQKMVWPMTAVGISFSNYQRGKAAIQRIDSFLNQEPKILDHGESLVPTISQIEFKDVSYSYEDDSNCQLMDLNFKIHKGETIGITGPIGSGKTTLAHLFVRLLEPNTGEILLNDKPFKSFDLSSLRRNIRLVTQETFLFSDTIRKNFEFPQSHEDHRPSAEELAEKVVLKHEIDVLPGGFESELGEKGVNLSGGQRQRLSIGRSWSIVSQVLILDDSLSAVDVKTESQISSEIQAAKESGKITIIISHRMKNLLQADRILCLRDGRIEGFEKPAELVKHSKTFSNLMASQGIKL